MTPCPTCGKDMTQDGVWPIVHRGKTVHGCYECFESMCDDIWWESLPGHEDRRLPAEEA